MDFAKNEVYLPIFGPFHRKKLTCGTNKIVFFGNLSSDEPLIICLAIDSYAGKVPLPASAFNAVAPRFFFCEDLSW